MLRLPGGVRLRVMEPHPADQRRLWRARPLPSVDLVGYLEEHGRPIRYSYVEGSWPLSDLQNVYADRPGSAEMASAGRPLTERTLVRLMARGVAVAPIELHTGRVQPGAARAAAAGALHRARGDRPARDQHGRGRPPGGRGRHHRGPRPRVGGPRRTGGAELGLDLTRARARTVRPAWSAACSPGCTLPRPATSTCSRRSPDASSWPTAYAAVTGPDSPAYLWHEFGDSMLLLP